jgi:competence protein ComEA
MIKFYHRIRIIDKGRQVMQGLREKMWLIIALFLAVSLITGGIFLSIRLIQLQPAEIALADNKPAAISGDVFIGGAVARPGIYSARRDDTLTSLVSSAGLSTGADTGHISIIVPDKTLANQPQKVNINRAESWLLQALPGIGEGKARMILDYRAKNGPFRSVDDLAKIEGFGKSIVDKVRDFAVAGD